MKDTFDINVELASPADFIPMKPGWQDRSPFVAQEGVVTFRHFDLHAQALYRFPAIDPASFRKAVCAAST